MTLEQVVFIDDAQLALDGAAKVAMTAIKTDNTTTIAELNRLLHTGARTQIANRANFKGTNTPQRPQSHPLAGLSHPRRSADRLQETCGDETSDVRHGLTVPFVGAVATVVVAVAQPLLLNTSVVVAFEFVRLAQEFAAAALTAGSVWAEFEGNQRLCVEGCGEFGHGRCRHQCQPYRGCA
ncbi:hypothetical protein IU450_39060 [Nocardia abscessus]|uniref:hypothetical protein n=1 Tax=Nocardia abscessus TaxID=120957 RepID=UPI001895CAC6|nr:hypothetical protein [Nocardia abscessus]MBF6206112.1 hypothetical protein [Streptomyces gardneri]MBF6341838.1 hypothetical protein [Nocardia abscessus]